LGAQLLQIATEGGARSLGVRDTAGRLAVGLPFDACVVDLAAPSLREVPEEHALDAWMLAGTAQAVTAVYVAGVRRL
jgi:cytosine/adenosine deaminase-related metal-dependent hydrolase